MTDGEDLGTAVSTFVERAAAPPGQLYHVLLFAPEAHRDTLGAAFAFHHEVARSAGEGVAPEVASTRLAWWGEEVARVANAEPRHPLTRLLLERAGQQPSRLAGLLAEIVGAAQAACVEPLPAATADLEHRLGHDRGALCRLAARALAVPAGRADEPWVEVWGRSLGLAWGLRETGWTAAHASRGASRLAEAARALPEDARAAQRPLLVLASLEADRQGTAARGAGARPGRTAALTASLSTLWLAWRAAGAAARGRLPANLARLSRHRPQEFPDHD